MGEEKLMNKFSFAEINFCGSNFDLTICSLPYFSKYSLVRLNILGVSLNPQELLFNELVYLMLLKFELYKSRLFQSLSVALEL